MWFYFIETKNKILNIYKDDYLINPPSNLIIWSTILMSIALQTQVTKPNWKD